MRAIAVSQQSCDLITGYGIAVLCEMVKLNADYKNSKLS
jgi:hypothetical protein